MLARGFKDEGDLTIAGTIDSFRFMNEEGLVEYRIELAATFDMDIYSTVLGPPGLDRQAIEEIVEREWAWISADKNVLQESSWQLVGFHATDERRA
jgi:hypothetical protein